MAKSKSIATKSTSDTASEESGNTSPRIKLIPPPSIRRAMMSKEEKEKYTHIEMDLDADTVIKVRYIKDYLKLNYEVDAIKVASEIASLLLSEIKRGNNIIIQNKLGSQVRLNIQAGGKHE